jgi:hypothetical protein
MNETSKFSSPEDSRNDSTGDEMPDQPGSRHGSAPNNTGDRGGRERRRRCPSHPRRRVAAPSTEDATAGAERPSRPDGFRKWIVLLEAAGDDDSTFLDVGTVRAMLALMGDRGGIGLHCRERMAVQVRVGGADPGMALSRAMSRWRAAAVRLIPPGWDLVRAEVLTPDEFTRECESG